MFQIHELRHKIIRRDTLDSSAAPISPTVDLWMLRLLCDAGLWRDLRVGDMTDYDDIARCSWFSDFRLELNCSAFLSANTKFLRSGRTTDINYDYLPRRRSCRSEFDLELKDGQTKKAKIIAPADRASYLINSVEDNFEEMDSLVDLTDANPSTVGSFWRDISKNGAIHCWLGHKEPSTLAEAKKKLEKIIRSEIQSLGVSGAQNFSELQETFGLTELEVRVFAFVLAVTMQNSGFADILSCLDFSHGGLQLMIELAATALNEKKEAVAKCFDSDAALQRSGLLKISYNNSDDICSLFEFLDDGLYHSLLSTRVPVSKLMEVTFSKASAAELKLDDFGYLQVVRRMLLPYLRKVLEKRSSGANILLYGLPGTGKTQLTRVLADELGAKLYEVSAGGKSSRVRGGDISRLQCWKMACAFLSNADRALIAIDEAEDLFNDTGGLFFLSNFLGKQLQRLNKGEINKLLEENPVPTFWITNSISAIDPAMIRRFDLVVEVPVPDIATRCKIAREAFKGKLSDASVQRLGQPEQLAPAVLSRTAKVASMAGFDQGQVSEADVIELINETLRAQHFGCVPGEASVLPGYYDPSFVNADTDLEKLAQGLREAGSGRLCLYGPPGTGKTAYVHWLARKLNRPLIRKTAAELLSCWVGQTEKLIAEAFREAQRSHALLLIDEADSFLRDRTLSRASWETTQVNEMLSQMESFDGYFVATTNLLDALDPASLRRFDLKAKFDFLKPGQAEALTRKVLDSNGLDMNEAAVKSIASFNGLTPGDFAAVARQSRFKPLVSAQDLLERLTAELKVKGCSIAVPMGFA